MQILLQTPSVLSVHHHHHYVSQPVMPLAAPVAFLAPPCQTWAHVNHSPFQKDEPKFEKFVRGKRLETMDGSLGFKHLVVTKNQGSFPWYPFRPICRLCVVPIEMHCRAANAAHQGGDWQSHHQVETVHLQGGLYSRPHLQVEQQDIWVCSRSQQVGRNDRFVGRLWPHCWCFHRSCLDHVLQGSLSYIYRSCKNICSSFCFGVDFKYIFTYTCLPLWGQTGCKNYNPGGESVRGGDGPFFVYMVFRSFKNPPPVPKLESVTEDPKPCVVSKAIQEDFFSEKKEFNNIWIDGWNVSIYSFSLGV